MLLLLLLAGCCGQEPPRWYPIDVLEADPDVSLNLAEYVENDGGELAWWIDPEPGVSTGLDGDTLSISGDPGFEGYTHVEVTAADDCGNEASTTLSVHVSNTDTAPTGSCTADFAWAAGPASVQVAGSFSDWEPVELEATDSGFALSLELPAGDYSYKYVVDGQWACEPEGALFVCEEGQAWDPACTPGGNGCNSILRVVDCEAELVLDRLDIDREARSISAGGHAGAVVADAWATLDGAAIDAWSGEQFTVEAAGLSAGRHSLRIGGSGLETLHIPFWLDGRGWDEGLLYFAFVDRFADGDPSLDQAEGADVDYLGGDWRGLIDQLDHLDALGVSTIWLTAPVDNAEGAFAGDCNVSYSAYHGYWPDSDGLEEHFGDEATLRELITEAHARNMRVMVDQVANHVHEDHPWYAEHPEWFNPQYICDADEDGDGVLNWDQRTETCWFDSFLPDVDYTQSEPLLASLDEALAFAKDYDIDGMRVDAVKHLPIAYWWDLQSRVREELEHRGAGGDEDFRLVGETFDGSSKIASYLDDRLLDAQFDFPLYWAIVQAFARDEIGLSNGDGSLKSALDASRSAYGGALMSTFLGNHDVERFISQASGETSSLYGDWACDDDGDGLVTPDESPAYSEPYERLKLAWTFLLTTEGQPLVYYGDEIGLPGHADPDNRQMMRWTGLSEDEAGVLAHVQALGQARKAHPAMAHGTRVEWWENEAEVWAYARVEGEDQVLVLLNRSAEARSLQNGLAWAGLAEGEWVDLLSAETFSSDGDSLTVDVPARGSRVLVKP